MIDTSIFYFGGNNEEGQEGFESPIQRIDLENETIADGVEVIGNHDFDSFFPNLLFPSLSCAASLD